MHVDDFIDLPDLHSNDFNLDYAKWVLFHFRLPANYKIRFNPFMAENKLFGMYKGVKYRITGASRLGDVWLTSDFDQQVGYEQRVDVADITNWMKR